VRTLRIATKAEQFGPPVVRVTASSRTQWPYLVAVLVLVKANGSETLLSEGGAATSFGRQTRTVRFRLISTANLVPRGGRLRLYLGATSTIQSFVNRLYLKPVPAGSQLSIGKVSLSLPVLPKAISG
jgi:predicted acyl esterase